jgi:hypothetical protein
MLLSKKEAALPDHSHALRRLRNSIKGKSYPSSRQKKAAGYFGEGIADRLLSRLGDVLPIDQSPAMKKHLIRNGGKRPDFLAPEAMGAIVFDAKYHQTGLLTMFKLTEIELAAYRSMMEEWSVIDLFFVVIPREDMSRAYVISIGELTTPAAIAGAAAWGVFLAGRDNLDLVEEDWIAGRHAAEGAGYFDGDLPPEIRDLVAAA